MKQFHWRKLATVTLIITLVLGILSSAFGVTVVAITAKPEKEEAETETLENGTVPEGTLEDVAVEKFEFPTLEYPALGNDLNLKNNVVVLSENDSKGITSSVIRMEAASSYSYGDHLVVTLEGEHAFSDTLRYGTVFFIRGSSTDPLGGRFFEFKGASVHGGQTVLEVKEPYFEDVFESLEMCLSNTLTQANLVKAYYANGVTSHFGNVETEIPDMFPTASAVSLIRAKTSPQKEQNPTAPSLARTVTSSTSSDLPRGLSVRTE